MPLDIKEPSPSPSGIAPQVFFEDIATEFTLPAVTLPELRKEYEAECQARCLQPPLQALFSSHGQKARGIQFSCIGGLSRFAATPCEAVKSSQRRFLIFDQSGNQTRLLRCTLPLQYPSTVGTGESSKLHDVHLPVKESGKDNFIPEKILLDEDFDGNHISGKESEMHEDTEEINALLYSDEDNDDNESDDEVMSTGHSPFPTQEEVCNKIEYDEVNSDDNSRKKQKLLDGSYCKSSIVDTALSSTDIKRSVKGEKLAEADNKSSSKQEMGSGLSSEQSKGDKIRIALKILERIVPGAKGKEAFLLLDEAIDHLKVLKRSVKHLGFTSR